jgi:hypothetical protein
LIKTLLPKKKPSIKQGLPVKKKALLTVAFLSVLLLSAVAGTQLFNLGRANPYSQAVYSGETSSVPNTEPPIVSIFSPANNVLHNTNNISLTFNVSVGKSTATIGMWTDSGMWISKVYYEADWQENSTFAYQIDTAKLITDFSYSLDLRGIPDGKHRIVVYATESGTYFPDLFHYYDFSINGASSVNFTIDTTPIVSFLSFENRTFETSDVPLNFTVNQSVSKITYSLDGQENVTVAENTTLTDLSNGYHNVTVYAIDSAGNTGTSETIYFNVEVPEPFPTTQVIASIASVAVVGVGLLVYFKKRNH